MGKSIGQLVARGVEAEDDTIGQQPRVRKQEVGMVVVKDGEKRDRDTKPVDDGRRTDR